MQALQIEAQLSNERYLLPHETSPLSTSISIRKLFWTKTFETFFCKISPTDGSVTKPKRILG